MANEPSLSIFISYASYDNIDDNPEDRWLDRLLQFLKPLALEGEIVSWADTKLSPGANWRGDIRTAIENAQVAVLLVSPAFLASEFIRTEELPQLLQQANPMAPERAGEEMAEAMLILPILIRPCLIDYAKFELLDGTSETRFSTLSEFQYVPKGRAMNGLSQYEQDKQFESIARRIIEALEIDAASAVNAASFASLSKLDDLLVNFCAAHAKWWFNALRIHRWGSAQPGYTELGDYSHAQIKMALEGLAQNGRLQSKKGKRSQVYKL